MKNTPLMQLIWSCFSADSLLKDASEAEKNTIKSKQNSSTWVKLHLAAYVFLFVNVFFVLSDIITGFYDAWDYTYLNITAELIFIFSSIGTLIALRLLKERDSRFVPVIQFIYYLIVETAILLYFSSDILRGVENITNAFYNMVVLVIFVTYSFRLVAVLTSYIFSVGAVLLLTLQSEFIWANFQLLLLLALLFFLCANYFRANNTRHLLSLTKLENAQEALEKLSTKDFLTKLSNRTALNAFVKHNLNRAIGEGKHISLTMLDIDDFKAYNDYYSHITGDKCLHDIAAVILALDSEKFASFRYGGEEFLIIGIDVSEAECQEHARKIIEGVRSLAIKRDDGLNALDIVTVSIGLAHSVSIETSDFASLLLRADKELYRAKRAGKNCYFFRGGKNQI